MRRMLCALLFFAASATACSQDRPRPDPTELPSAAPSLVALITEPVTNSTIRGAAPVEITVLARDTAAQPALIGAALVSRVAGIRIDSVVITFEARDDTTHVFSLMVPDRVTNTRFDVQAIAFNSQGDTVVSPITRLIIVRCAPGVPGC